MVRKAMTAIAAMVLCVSATASTQDSGLPPPQYMNENVAIVIFANRVTDYCGLPPEGMVMLGCVLRPKGKPPVMVLPNPNAPAFKGEFFSRIASHELGHWNGWSGDHPR